MRTPKAKKIIIAIIAVSLLTLVGVLIVRNTTPKEIVEIDISPIYAGEEKIEFNFTDDNTEENLIIMSDKRTYYGFDRAVVYFVVANDSGYNLDLETAVYFKDDKRRVESVERLNPPVILERPEGAIESRESTAGDWQSLTLSSALGAIARSSNYPRKSVDNYSNITSFTTELEAGKTAYFRAKITYPPLSDGKFYIESFGRAQARNPIYFSGDWISYGHLDPWHISNSEF